MDSFFTEVNNKDFISVYNKFFIKNDIHYNEEGNKFIAEKFLKDYKNNN